MKRKVILLLIIFITGCNTKQVVEKPIEEPIEVIEEKKLTEEDYKENNVNEMGLVPIMMYHGIHNKLNSDTQYTGGNVDKDGYQRTSEAFRNDLEFYYNNGYRMIRLTDYVDGNIDTELGKSPIILTFDDGLENNIKVTGLDSKGNIIIDPNSAVGILEEYKKKYPDFNVTATFFVTAGLFNQSEYNEQILKWLVNNGYDIGNHTISHVNFSNATTEEAEIEVGKLYSILDNIIPGKYVNIVALPYGSPYNLSHYNMEHIYKSTYNGKTYETKATLRVGWESEDSPFTDGFNPKFLKRIRAYDNDGVEFDIKMNFDILAYKKYISDGNKDTVVIPSSKESLLNKSIDKEIIIY